MFRKIVSNLSFSPALIGQIGFYAKRLRKEEISRRLGLIFTVFALVVQSLVVFQPAESANAASNNDFVYGGLQSLDSFIQPYDKNTNNLKDIVNYFGITRDELTKAQYTTWTVGETLSWGYQSKFSYEQGERKLPVTNESGAIVTTIYGRPNRLFSSAQTKISGWVGHSTKIGWFAVLKACGNLVTNIIPPAPPKKCTYNASLLASDSRCKPCPGKDTLWIEDSTCNAVIVRKKSAVNITQGSVNATTVTANATDTIKYTLTVENKGIGSDTVALVENLSDVLEYATIIDNGGGTFSDKNKTLSWSSITLKPGEKQTRVFAIRMLDAIPSTAKGASEPTSYNCIITNVFGNQIDIKVNCPSEKIVEAVVTELPTTGPTENLLFGGILLAVVVFFYARSRQLRTELRLIRTHVNSGVL